MRQYSPPYGSPIEDMLAWSFSKHLADGVTLQTQHEIATFAGRFRLDFLATCSERLIGLECDGAAFHDYTRDMFRDSIILGCSSIAAIYRIGGADIHLPSTMLFTLYQS